MLPSKGEEGLIHLRGADVALTHLTRVLGWMGCSAFTSMRFVLGSWSFTNSFSGQG